jgi:hypothetical protein
VKETLCGDKPVILITPDIIPSNLPYDVGHGWFQLTYDLAGYK